MKLYIKSANIRACYWGCRTFPLDMFPRTDPAPGFCDTRTFPPP